MIPLPNNSKILPDNPGVASAYPPPGLRCSACSACKLPRYPKTPPRRAKRHHDTVQEAPRCPQEASRCPQEASRCLQDGPRSPQDGFQELQDAPRPDFGRFFGAKLTPKTDQKSISTLKTKNQLNASRLAFSWLFVLEVGSKNR